MQMQQDARVVGRGVGRADGRELRRLEPLLQQLLGSRPLSLLLLPFWRSVSARCLQTGIKNPFQDSISFDNIGYAWVAIFLVISLEGWTDIMYYVQDAHSFHNWVSALAAAYPIILLYCRSTSSSSSSSAPSS